MRMSLWLLLIGSFLVVYKHDELYNTSGPKNNAEGNTDEWIAAPSHCLHSNLYENLAHQALKRASVQPNDGNRNTLFDVFLAAAQLDEGVLIKVQFLTVESICNNSMVYSEEECPPLGTEPNGMCDATFVYSCHPKLKEVVCEPLP